MEMNDFIESSKYSFFGEIDLSCLADFPNHRRLGVFFHKGTECANPECNRVGTRLIYGKNRAGQIHLDVYTEDLTLMTVDHVIPRSLGGSDHLSNKEPMCRPCNERKGNAFVGVDKFDQLGNPKSSRNSKKLKRANQYGRKWRKYIRRNSGIVYVGVGLLQVDTPRPTMLTFLKYEKKRREESGM